MMKGTPAIYKGRIVDKNNFCAFVFSPNGEKKLIKSWSQYESHVQSGVWFPTLKDALESKAPEMKVEEPDVKEEPKPKAKPKSKPKSKAKPKAQVEKVEEVEEPSDELPDDGSVFEVTGEDGA